MLYRERLLRRMSYCSASETLLEQQKTILQMLCCNRCKTKCIEKVAEIC